LHQKGGVGVNNDSQFTTATCIVPGMNPHDRCQGCRQARARAAGLTAKVAAGFPSNNGVDCIRNGKSAINKQNVRSLGLQASSAVGRIVENRLDVIDSQTNLQRIMLSIATERIRSIIHTSRFIRRMVMMTQKKRKSGYAMACPNRRSG
uniref:Transposase n=1 Tax=Heligmosomoides polygyrus TaxID=6339 RepID=A0A183GLU6_HELPZ